MGIPYFFGAAAGGFVLMAAVGIQALVALFSSIPLAKRRKKENDAFDLKRAYRRIVQVSFLVVLVCGVVTALVVHFAPIYATAGYLMGMILAFVLSIKRMSPNDATNQKNFETSYTDCYPPSDVNPDDAIPANAGEATPDGEAVPEPAGTTAAAANSGEEAAGPEEK
ncbi:MAG: hypothetical protein RRY97_07450 [Oscillibacter sp.]